MTSIRTYDPASAGTALPDLPPLPIGALVVGAAELLQQAADLPAPVYVTVHQTQTIDVQFAQTKASTSKTITVGRHGGSPLMLKEIDAACTETGIWPHAVISGHAHHGKEPNGQA